MAKTLTEQQARFISVLFSDEAKGDIWKAKLLAGYSPDTPNSYLVKALEDEILAETRRFLSKTAPRAAFALGDVLENPTQLGYKAKLAAAMDILDRVGVSKTEKLDVVGNAIFVLPAKREAE